MTLKVFEAFAGVGTQRMALRNIGVEHEVVGISEIDKYAYQSYQAIHGETKNFGDITKIIPNELPDFDLFTYSFPCTDLSNAGKQEGMIRGKTRSGLLYECEKIIEAKLPRFLLLENVKPLVSRKFKPQFDEWLAYLESLGYTNYWKVLRANHYGSAQKRERVFVVSIRGEHEPYQFPIPSEPTLFMKDLLLDEKDVPEKAYKNKAFTLAKGYFYDATIDDYKFVQGSRIYAPHRPCPTLTRRGDVTLLIPQRENPQTEADYRIRKMQPIEMWRFMGISDEDYYKAVNAGVKKTQLVYQAGNAICVEVLERLFKSLFLGEVE